MNELQNMAQPDHNIEIWAGIECTVNRVGDTYYDQLIWNGHETRLDDLDRFASLGITAIRYPVLWERTAPNGLESADWRWPDERLNRLRELGIRPIVGLLHHGSGPLDTSLMDPNFPEKLAVYARAVAERYPWVDAYTPLNEILTTARFSGLYGHWYPHERSGEAFIRALVNQVKGVQLAMRAVREVNPDAQLIQTDDMGKIYSMPSLAYQAAHENERRWLGFDLLCGRVDKTHPLYPYLLYIGISEDELEAIRVEPSPPDIMGINYYITSERFLDDRLDHYPAEMRGGNGRDVYVDVEAVRVCNEEPIGFAGIMREVWDRYHLPMAATEVHLGGHREHQLRWWMGAWHDLQGLRQNGVDVRAITAWSLLGSFHWDKLVTSEDGKYESGLFDVRSSPPRPTILADAVRSVAQNGSFDHPVLDKPGWWGSPQRLLYPPVSYSAAGIEKKTISYLRTPARPILITGAHGTLGQSFQRICNTREIANVALSHRELDITDVKKVAHVLAEVRPWAVINAAGYVRVDDAEQDYETCRLYNTLGPAILAEACHQLGIQFLSFSSDLVFDGTRSNPYLESHGPLPINAYGRSKAEAEGLILQTNPDALVIRTSAFFGPWDVYNFPVQVLNALMANQPFIAANDTYVSPTYVPDLVDACLDLLVDGEQGIWHLANHGGLTWFTFAQWVAENSGLPVSDIHGQPVTQMGWAAPRPRYSVLGSERAMLLPSLEDALFRFVREQEAIPVR